jgi:excisionase family DNA binding protein
MEGNKNILTPDAAAREAGVCRKTIYNLLRSGQLKHVRAGDKYLISRANFEQWLSGDQLKAGTKPQ